jgi:hypothetical protein
VRVGECVCACGWMGRGARRTALFLKQGRGGRGGERAERLAHHEKAGLGFPSLLFLASSLSLHITYGHQHARPVPGGRRSRWAGQQVSRRRAWVRPLSSCLEPPERGKKEYDAPRSPKSIFFSLSQHRRPAPPTALPARCAASPIIPASVDCVRTARLASPSRRPTHKQQRRFVAATAAAAAPVAGVAGSYTLTQVIAVIIVS